MDNEFHKAANISDKITVIGNLEHALYHARKSAGVKADNEEDERFFQVVAAMVLDFRRRYMKKHFPDCSEELWCLGKAIETARQRVYEADEGDSDDLNDIDAIWQMVWERITGQDLSACSACREDSGGLTEKLRDGPQNRLGQGSTGTHLQDDKVKARLKMKPDDETYLELDKWYLISAELERWDDELVKDRPLPSIIVKIYDLDGKYLTYREYLNIEDLKAFWDFGGKYPGKWDIELAAAGKDYEAGEMTVEEAKKQFQIPSL